MANRQWTCTALLHEMLLGAWVIVLFGGSALVGLGGSATALAQSASVTSQNSATARPQPGSLTVAEKIAASQKLLDINTATAEQLKALPGMGEAYAARVIAGRPYTAKNQLTTRGILPKDEYERIRDLIIAHRPKP